MLILHCGVFLNAKAMKFKSTLLSVVFGTGTDRDFFSSLQPILSIPFQLIPWLHLHGQAPSIHLVRRHPPGTRVRFKELMTTLTRNYFHCEFWDPAVHRMLRASFPGGWLATLTHNSCWLTCGSDKMAPKRLSQGTKWSLSLSLSQPEHQGHTPFLPATTSSLHLPQNTLPIIFEKRTHVCRALMPNFFPLTHE